MNTTTAVFRTGSRCATAQPLTQYDVGQILIFEGITLPENFEVHFSNQKYDGESMTCIGTDGQVEIPNEYLQSGEPVYVMVYLHYGENDGKTEYRIMIPVDKRPCPADIEPGQEGLDTISQAIATLNAGIATVQAEAEAAEDAKEAIQDLGVEIELLQPDAQEYVQKNVDAETGAVTLKFGIPRGYTGEAGAGMPAGGSTGDVYVKVSDADYDTEWSGDLTRLKSGLSDIETDMGDLEDLHTTAKSDLVSAINEAAQETQADWTEADTTSEAYIRNKPSVDSGDADDAVIIGEKYDEAVHQVVPIDSNIASGKGSIATGGMAIIGWTGFTAEANSTQLNYGNQNYGTDLIWFDTYCEYGAPNIYLSLTSPPVNAVNIVSVDTTNKIINLSQPLSEQAITSSTEVYLYLPSQAIEPFSKALSSGCIALSENATADGYACISTAPCSHSEGSLSIADSWYGHAEGCGTRAYGNASHAEGIFTQANEPYTHAEGNSTIASGNDSHAQNTNTVASGRSTHAEGRGTIANSYAQHAGGLFNIADPTPTTNNTRGTYAEIIGNGTSANARSNARTLDWNGNAWFAGDVTDGSGNTLSQLNSAVNDLGADIGSLESLETTDKSSLVSAINEAAQETQSDWNETDTTGEAYIQNKPPIDSGDADNAVTIGEKYNETVYPAIPVKSNIASGKESIATGGMAVEEWIDFTAEANSTQLYYGEQTFGNDMIWFETYFDYGAPNIYLSLTNPPTNVAHVVSVDTTNKIINLSQPLSEQAITTSTGVFLYLPARAIEKYSKALSSGCIASEENATADGWACISAGYYSHTEGRLCIADKECCHAEGSVTRAHGNSSHAEGRFTQANEFCSHAEGRLSVASGLDSHAQNTETVASGRSTHAEGSGTIANSYAQHAGGLYNVADPVPTEGYDRGTYVEIIGNGTSENARSNARTLDWDGNAWFAGDVTDGSGNTLSQLNSAVNGKASQAMIATVESSTTASKAYAVGDLLVLNGTLYEVTIAIGSGETITVGTNVAATTVDATMVKDVQVDGTSVVTNGVANVPVATSSSVGVVKVNSAYGVVIDVNDSGRLMTQAASDYEIKVGGSNYRVIVPPNQHKSVFYGLATAAGDTTQKASDNAVGVYTDNAKIAIQEMIGVNASISNRTIRDTTSTDVTLVAEAETRYVYGELASLSVTSLPSQGIVDIVFQSGTTATVLDLPQAVKLPSWFSVGTSMTIEINILDGVYGSVQTWT